MTIEARWIEYEERTISLLPPLQPHHATLVRLSYYAGASAALVDMVERLTEDRNVSERILDLVGLLQHEITQGMDNTRMPERPGGSDAH